MVFFEYLIWHFKDAPLAICRAWRNYLYFALNYFSVPLLLRTFFSPWRRYAASYGKGFNPKRFVETLVFNLMSRVIGVVFRFVFIIIGILAEAGLFGLGLAVLVLWLILPILLCVFLITGIKLLFYV